MPKKSNEDILYSLRFPVRIIKHMVDVAETQLMEATSRAHSPSLTEAVKYLKAARRALTVFLDVESDFRVRLNLTSRWLKHEEKDAENE